MKGDGGSASPGRNLKYLIEHHLEHPVEYLIEDRLHVLLPVYLISTLYDSYDTL